MGEIAGAVAEGPARAPARARRALAWASRLGTDAWIAVAVTAAFIAVTAWWLALDDAPQPFDAGSHLITAFEQRDYLASGDLAGVLGNESFYPPLIFLVGALGAFAAGVDVSGPVIAENLVFVSLLALGCYKAGTLAYGTRAGLLAVVFALGSPLIVEQFHVFMIDAPLAALVALSAWLILRTDGFGRLGPSALAGVGLGLGLSAKEQFPLFVYGLLLVVLLRGGWRNWRGVLVCAGVAVAIALPWYVVHLDNLGLYASAALHNAATIPVRSMPEIASMANLQWYFWAVLNTLLFAPLFLFAATGLLIETVALVRRRAQRLGRRFGSSVAPELLGGLLGSWVALSFQPHHDIRYSLPLIFYLAVLGTGWITRLGSPMRVAATAALALSAVVATLGAAFGVGGRIELVLGEQPTRFETMVGVARADAIVLHNDENFIRGAPQRDGNVLRLLRALPPDTEGVSWLTRRQSGSFQEQGLFTAARMAGYVVVGTSADMTPRTAMLLTGGPDVEGPPCVRLADGTGIWIRYGYFVLPDPPAHCPWRPGG